MSKHPVMLSVKTETLSAVRAAASAAGIPTATLIVQMLDEMVPMLHSMAVAAQATKEKRLEAFDHLAESMASVNVAGAQLQLGIAKARRKAAKPKPRRKA